MKNALTVDVEDWFQVEAFAGTVDYADWHKFRLRVLPNVLKVLGIFQEHGVHATFFILGWLADRLPDIVTLIADSGHEIASHGYAHRLVRRQTPAEFREDVERSLDVIGRLSPSAIRGYRAPSFSIDERNPWGWSVLAELGIAYDSSVFPVYHDTYGSPEMPRVPFRFTLPGERTLIEFPMTTVRLGSANLAVGGGGYLRMFPYWYTRWALRRVNAEGIPGVVYVHPWELDPHQPRHNVPLRSRLRHYSNLASTEGKIHRLLAEFEFGTMAQVLAEIGENDLPRLRLDDHLAMHTRRRRRRGAGQTDRSSEQAGSPTKS